jgi:hypothetical protein
VGASKAGNAVEQHEVNLAMPRALVPAGTWTWTFDWAQPLEITQAYGVHVDLGWAGGQMYNKC